jgi:thiazole synthase
VEQASQTGEGSLGITVNGEPRRVPTGSTITTLLQDAKLLPRQVAVEVNKRLLRADRYDETLADGDSIEIVTFVGGG